MIRGGFEPVLNLLPSTVIEISGTLYLIVLLSTTMLFSYA
jgi:hypothetical protein